jgi:hypothetical protein
MWNDARVDHIARHGVRLEEVEDVCFGNHLAMRAGRNRYRLIGQTRSGRYLCVLLDAVSKGVFQPVTARDASNSE